MSWAQRAARNILPLSREKSDLPVALREWRDEGEFHDLEAPDADCELCDHPDIRYQFEIRNRFTDARLQIGSECINRFGIIATGYDGENLDAAGTRAKVSRDRRILIEKARKKRVVTTLVALSQADPSLTSCRSLTTFRTGVPLRRSSWRRCCGALRSSGFRSIRANSS